MALPWITVCNGGGFKYLNFVRFCVYVLVLLGCQAIMVHSHSCEVLVYNGVKTANCIKKELDYLPGDLGHDIKELVYKENKLNFLGINFFKDYLSLQYITMAYDQIEEIAPDAFKGLANLQSLDLEGNKLKEIPGKAFRHLSSLRMLFLKGNPITYITRDSFASLQTIESIDMENCHITRIEPQAFHDLQNLEEINLVNNELKTLDYNMEKYFPPNLKILRLYRNPWECNCHLRWLRNWINDRNGKMNWKFGSNSPACSTPHLIRGIDWQLLKPEQFACASHIVTNSTTGLELEPGQNITVECIVKGDPVPTVTWFKGQNGIQDDLSKYTIVSTGMNPVRSTLTVWNVMTNDLGSYRCVGENIAGRSEVTYKMWFQGTPDPDEVYASGMPLESILGIAVGAAVFLLILVFCAVYGFRKQDRRKHAYRVRDYKKPPKNKKDNNKKKKKTTNIDLEKMEKASVPSVTTELLPEKQDKQENHVKQITEKEKEPMMNHSNYDPKNDPEFKMKIFAYGDKKPPPEQTQLDLGVEGEGNETDPLCDGCESGKSGASSTSGGQSGSSSREVTPDLLHNHNHDPLKETLGSIDKEKRVENPYSTLPSRAAAAKESSKKTKNKEGIPPPPPPPVHYYMNRENLENAARDKTLNKKAEKEKKAEPSKGVTKEQTKTESGPEEKVASPLKGILKVTTPGPINKNALPETSLNGGPSQRVARVNTGHSVSDNVKNRAGNVGSKDDMGHHYGPMPTRYGGVIHSGSATVGRSPTKSRPLNAPSQPHAIAGTLPNPHHHHPHHPHTGPAKMGSPLKAQVPLRTLESSPTKTLPHRTGPGPTSSLHNVPIVKIPSTDPGVATLGRKDPRSLIIPAPPIITTTAPRSPSGQRSPASGSRSPASSQSSSAGSRDTISPPPKKPPRTFAATMEYLEDAAEKRNLLKPAGSPDGPPPKPGQKDDFGTAV